MLVRGLILLYLASEIVTHNTLDHRLLHLHVFSGSPHDAASMSSIFKIECVAVRVKFCKN